MWLVTVLVAVGAAGAATFVGLYSGSRGWYRTHVGQNLMAMAAVLLGLLVLVLLGRALGPLPRWVWAVGLAALDAVLWWRVVILWRLQRGRSS